MHCRSWNELPEMSVPRFRMACGVARSMVTGKTMIVVAGGETYGREYLSTSEVFLWEDKVWIKGTFRIESSTTGVKGYGPEAIKGYGTMWVQIDLLWVHVNLESTIGVGPMISIGPLATGMGHILAMEVRTNHGYDNHKDDVHRVHGLFVLNPHSS